MSGDHRARHGTDDLLGVPLCMSEGRRFARSAVSELQRRDARSGGDAPRPPSDNWVTEKLNIPDAAGVTRWCPCNTRLVARHARMAGMMRRGGTVALDITCNAYYGKTLKDEMYRSRPLRGTATFDAYMTAHSAGHEYDVPLDTRRIVKGDRVVDIVAKMLKSMGRRGMRPGLILVDPRAGSTHGRRVRRV